MLLTLYGAGLRRSELCQLKVRDIDSQRMVLWSSKARAAPRAVMTSPKTVSLQPERSRRIRQ